MIDYSSLTEKQKNRYDRILAVAEELMYEQGFNKLSLTQLTENLRISRSTIYEYFGTKEGLVEIIVDKITARLDETLDRVVNDESLEVYDKFVVLLEEQGKNIHRNFYRLRNDLRIHTPHLFQKFEDGRRKRESGGYYQLVQQGVKAKIFDPSLDKDFLVQLFLKMGQLPGDTDLLDNLNISRSDALRTIINVFLRGTARKQKKT